MKLTYEEQEKLAYISGETEKAKLLAEIIDLQDEVQQMSYRQKETDYHYENN